MTVTTVVQFGLATIPWCPLTAWALISGTTSGTAGSIRNAFDLSTTTAPARTANGACSFDCEVPAENRLGPEGNGFKLFMETLDGGRISIGAMALGLAQGAFERSVKYAKERETFGKKIGEHQAIAFKLADMAIEIDGARLLAWKAAWRLDQGGDALREATLAYQQVRRVALQVCDGAVQVLGGHGYTREYLPEMHLRNSRGYAAYEALALV